MDPRSSATHSRCTLALAALSLSALLCLLLPASSGAAGNLWEQVQEQLRNELVRVRTEPRPFCRREPLCGSQVLCAFYKAREYRPVWVDSLGQVPQGRSLVDAVRRADREGLNPEAYSLAAVEALLQEVGEGGEAADPEALADLDLLLTDTFIIYGSHLLAGRVDPETINPQWGVVSRHRDLAKALDSALERNGIQEALEGMLPSHAGYAALREALARHREIAGNGGWPPAPAAGPSLRPQDRDERVPVLRARLLASGDLEAALSEDEDPNLYDPALEEAVRRFQARHGLTSDGVTGKETLAAMAVSVERRVRQIELNLERWRWLPDDLGRRHVLVNTADYRLDVVEDGDPRFFMKVITGMKARLTPVFSGSITYLVLNPIWNVPHKIAVEDLLPKIQADPEYLKREKISVLETWERDAPEVDPATVDWSSLTRRNFTFRLRQEPGPRNALGRIKFIFPNKFAVYLHDTPAHHLFREIRRSFSSGCIRIQEPFTLAEYLLSGDPRWTRERIVEVVESGKSREVVLREPVPVHVLYWTSWVDADGRVQFREDIYDRDRPLDQALAEGPPKGAVPPSSPNRAPDS